jgi:hypothetical protein
MSLKKILSFILPLMVLALSIEIVWRRFIVGQIPTQFSALPVYALIAVNALYFSYEYSQLLKKRQR